MTRNLQHIPRRLAAKPIRLLHKFRLDFSAALLSRLHLLSIPIPPAWISQSVWFSRVRPTRWHASSSTSASLCATRVELWKWGRSFVGRSAPHRLLEPPPAECARALCHPAHRRAALSVASWGECHPERQLDSVRWGFQARIKAHYMLRAFLFNMHFIHLLVPCTNQIRRPTLVQIESIIYFVHLFVDFVKISSIFLFVWTHIP